MTGFGLHRLGTVMKPDPDDPREAEGVLNPAAARGPYGQPYLFPCLVGHGEHSRIGLARVIFDEAGDPCGVERMGTAPEPEADYERRDDGTGGCEDPRVTFVEPLRRYVMTYTAFSVDGPRLALAVPNDLPSWERPGLATFGPYEGIDFDGVDDKDASVFPVAIPNPSAHPELAILRQPSFADTGPEDTAPRSAPREVDLDRESIWISYGPISTAPSDGGQLGRFTSHHRLVAPVSPFEQLKIGGWTAPILTRHGWLIVYHGVSDIVGPDDDGHHLRYSAGVMLLSREHPQMVRWRSVEPVLTPDTPAERHGSVANVAFPTGIDRRDDLGRPGRFDVYYGMADDRIGVARLDLPDVLPPGGFAERERRRVACRVAGSALPWPSSRLPRALRSVVAR